MSGTVIALGLVSLVTDASAEMVTAILPLYLMYGLGLGFLQLGALDALYTGATAVLRLAGGHLADRLGRPKAVAIAGYGLSALTKLGLPAVGGSLAGLSSVIAVDRAGKGIRTAPRDALISLSTPVEDLGRAFGVHRALDTAGALLGPLLGFAIIAAIPGSYDVVFSTSFCLAAIGVLILVFFVTQPRTLVSKAAVSVRAGLAAATAPELRRLIIAAGLLGLVTVGDMFLYFSVQRTAGLPPAVLPLLPLGTALTFMLAAIPFGRLADRIGRWKLFLVGHGLLLGAYLLIAADAEGRVVAAAVLLLHGLFYAASDGVLMAYAGPLIPASLRATGMAVVQTAQAVARAAGALAFGAMAAWVQPGATFGLFAIALAAAIGVGAWLGRPEAAR
ncbi:MFS transporter [Kribbella sp. NPDC056861]|uniref:MFS transporter n=1 Tax=Kribbella sp. NPDC056861 TaxID=3154857 RepID=UPI00341A2B9A